MPTGPVLAPDYLDRVLERLGLVDPPTLDLSGLNGLYAAFCVHVPDDNIQKRVWFGSDRRHPVTGGDPVQFFDNWLRYGTGGTCWPINGAFCTLLQSLRFDARRIAGSMLVEANPGANHGSVVVAVEGRDYLVDAQIASFEALPLDAHTETGTDGLHGISATPLAHGSFDIGFRPGVKREHPLVFRTIPELNNVDHAFFLQGYDQSTRHSPFNDCLYISRHYPDGLVTVYRNSRIAIDADNAIRRTELTDAARNRVLIEELEISEDIVAALPPDVPGPSTWT